MKRYIDLFKQTWTEFNDDKAPRLGAALAFYTVFSLAPLLLIAIAIAGIVFGRDAAQGEIFGQLRSVLGSSAAKAVQDMVRSAAKPRSGAIATVIGVVTLLVGATGVFGQLKDALNTIWNVTAKKAGGIKAMIKERFLSMVMVLGVGFLLLVSLILDTAVAAAGHFLGSRLPGGEALWQAIQVVGSFAVVTLLFALIFRFLPDVHPTWHDVWFGAAFTSVLFVIGKFALGLYLGKSAVGSSYGAAGSLVVVLLWVYYSAQILFFGAEFTQVYARRHGSMQGDTTKANAKAKTDRVEDRPKAQETFAPPRPMPVAANAKANRGGGKGKIFAGGAAGLVVGTLVGGLTASVVAFKSVKKLITVTFR